MWMTKLRNANRYVLIDKTTAITTLIRKQRLHLTAPFFLDLSM